MFYPCIKVLLYRNICTLHALGSSETHSLQFANVGAVPCQLRDRGLWNITELHHWTCDRKQIKQRRLTSLFRPVYDFISLTSHSVVQCHFQASWQRGHVRLWRWTGTAANHGGPSPGRRPAVPVRRARSLELQEPDPPVWTVRGGGAGASRLSSLFFKGATSVRTTQTWAHFSWGRPDFFLHWILSVLKHMKKIKCKIQPYHSVESCPQSQGS